MEYTNNLQNYVKEFQEVFKHPVANTPKPLQLERGISRSIWKVEEIVEFLHALSSNRSEFVQAFEEFSKGLHQAYEKSLHAELAKNDVDHVVMQMDALSDLLYFTFGTAVEIGVDVEKIFEIVQASNMSKLFTDEKGNKYVKYRGDGKVLKSPEFFPPETKIMEEIKRQMNE